jgi:hypothetical protein
MLTGLPPVSYSPVWIADLQTGHLDRFAVSGDGIGSGWRTYHCAKISGRLRRLALRTSYSNDYLWCLAMGRTMSGRNSFTAQLKTL